MHSTHSTRLIAALAAVAFVGAGCAPSDGVSVPSAQANGDTLLSYDAYDGTPITIPEPPAPAPEPSAPAPVQVPTASSDPNPTSSMAATQPRPTSFPGILPAARIQGKQVRLQTTKGEIVFELFDGEAPKTVSNFVALAESGFYDGLTFHRVVPGFVIQGGDPQGDGRGGPGYKFEDEPVTREYDAGIVAMANSGPNTNGSQFFIMLEDVPLDKLYTIFGKVTKGQEVVRAIGIGDVMTEVVVEDKK